jgi:hypothetical protein
MLGLLAAQPQEEAQTIDPRTVLYSISTIADEIGPLDPIKGTPTNMDVILHEDDWRQIEFFKSSRLEEIQVSMERLAAFEAANRKGQGFRDIFVRRLSPSHVLKASEPLSLLTRELGAEARPGPILVTSSEITGRVAPGFAFVLPGNVSLYGRTDSSGVTVLAADIGQGGDHNTLVKAFVKLNKAYDLVVVDWRSQMILTGVAPDGSIEVWRPR